MANTCGSWALNDAMYLESGVMATLLVPPKWVLKYVWTGMLSNMANVVEIL
jgi:hypothetical protein